MLNGLASAKGGSALLNAVQEAVVFRLDGQRYALPLSEAVRVFRAAEITPVPNANPFQAGAVDIAGEVIPVINTRRALGMPERSVRLDDQLIQVRGEAGTAVLWVDGGTEVVGFSAAAPAAERTPNGTATGAQLLRDEEGLVPVVNLKPLILVLKEAAAGSMGGGSHAP
jgi:purine-binding chemotaxis protein CheW